jgi:hypothetical protein
MKKFKAFINVFDNDYPAFIKSEGIMVDSWEEAEAYCKHESWSGESYILTFLLSITCGGTISNFREWRDYRSEFRLCCEGNT